MFLLLAALASSAFAHKLKPEKLVFYLHEITRITPETALNATAHLITTSNAGTLFILSQPLTEGPSPTSKSVGHQYGTSSAVGTLVNGSLVLFVAYDLHLKAENYTGTVAVQGAADVAAPAGPLILPILSGTGDFYLARGYASITFVEDNAITPTGVFR